MRNPNLSFIRTALHEIGAPIPEAFTRTDEQTQKITAAHQELTATRQKFGYDAIADAWGSAVLDGRDPSTDPGIIRALVANALADGDVGYAASNIVEQRLITELRDLVDPIMTALDKATSKAGASLSRAHQILGDTRLDDVNTIHGLGPAALQASIDANEANRVIRLVDNAWRALAELTQAMPTSTPTLVRLTAPNVDQFDQLRNIKDAWVYVQHGLTIELATTREEVESREQHIVNTRAERDARYDGEATKARTSGLRFR